MSKTITVKKRSSNLPKIKMGWSGLAAILLVIIGTISFIYADGLTVLSSTWFNLTMPHLQLEIKPQNTIIPANSSAQIYIDLQLTQKGKLLDGAEIIVNTMSGQVDITETDPPPANISKRILLRAPNQPQVVTLSFTYKHLTKNLAIDVYDLAPPSAPVIKAPTPGANFTTATPTIIGEAPNNQKVEIYTDDTLNTTAEVKDGNFSTILQVALKRGKHKIAAATINKYNIRSSLTPAITIDIQTPDPEIDLANLRIKPNPVQSNSTFQIFIPISSNTQAVQLIMDGIGYPLQDTNQSSVFSGVIPAPKNPGFHRLSLMITTDSGENILAEKVASLQVN